MKLPRLRARRGRAGGQGRTADRGREGAEEHGRPGGLSEILPPVKVVKLAAHSILDTYIAHGHLHILTELKALFP